MTNVTKPPLVKRTDSWDVKNHTHDGLVVEIIETLVAHDVTCAYVVENNKTPSVIIDDAEYLAPDVFAHVSGVVLGIEAKTKPSGMWKLKKRNYWLIGIDRWSFDEYVALDRAGVPIIVVVKVFGAPYADGDITYFVSLLSKIKTLFIYPYPETKENYYVVPVLSSLTTTPLDGWHFARDLAEIDWVELIADALSHQLYGSKQRKESGGKLDGTDGLRRTTEPVNPWDSFGVASK
jgi:hypothetical protein